MTLYLITLDYDKKRSLILGHIKFQTECTLNVQFGHLKSQVNIV